MSRTARELAAVYDSLPKIECKRLCFDCCGPIAVATQELRAARKIMPVAAKKTEPGYHQPAYDHFTMRCSLLSDQNECKIYEARPLICRLWGLVEKLRCPFGCVPERWVTDEEAADLLERVERAGR